MKELTVYLCGAMSHLTYEEQMSWRKLAMYFLNKCGEDTGCNVRVINPVFYYNFQEKRHQSELEVMNFDLDKVRESNILLVNSHKLETSIGSLIEMYEAYKNNIRVIVFGNNEYLHPWTECCISRTEDTMEDAISYIEDFYMS